MIPDTCTIFHVIFGDQPFQSYTESGSNQMLAGSTQQRSTEPGAGQRGEWLQLQRSAEYSTLGSRRPAGYQLRGDRPAADVEETEATAETAEAAKTAEAADAAVAAFAAEAEEAQVERVEPREEPKAPAAEAEYVTAGDMAGPQGSAGCEGRGSQPLTQETEGSGCQLQ